MHYANDIPWDCITDVLAGDATEPEREALRRWLAERPEHRALMAAARSAWEADYPSGAPDIARLKASVSARIGMDIGATGRALYPASVRVNTSRRWTPWYGVAALVAGVVVTLLGWTAGVHHVNGRVATSTLTYTTGNGQRANITLQDGSTVALGVASRLEVPADYVRGHRTVNVTGEALFAVVHQDGAPFTVVSGPITTRVLGTSFMVRHYGTDTTTTVAVRDGKVAVRSVVLTAAQQAVIGRDGTAHVQAVDAGEFSFALGVLTLNNVPFRVAVVELNRWYDTDIRIGDPALAAQAVTGQFAAGSLTNLADVLAGTFNVRVMRDGRVLTLFPR